MKKTSLSRARLAAISIIATICCGWTPGIAVAKDAADTVATANNAFALDLYGNLAGEDQGNLFFSPTSIETALAMTYAGARGATAGEMAAVLHLPPGSKTIHKDFGSFISQLNATGAEAHGYQISAANALWGQAGFHFLPDFTSLLHEDYGAGLQEVDFRHNAEGARRTINDWVDKATNDKITDLIGPNVLKPSTRLVLANAIYFKGTWAAKFNKAASHDAAFHLSAGKDKTVPTMSRTGLYGYLEGSDFQALKLDYAGGELSMVILLPRRVDGLTQLEKELTPELLSGSLGKIEEEQVAVSIPKFRMKKDFELGSTLGSMGMKDAFGPAADFSGMTGNRDLFLSNVIHKAFVAVYEEGTEAAAATTVQMVGMAMMAPPRTTFVADHPFIFMIRDEKSGAILFMGRLMEPD